MATTPDPTILSDVLATTTYNSNVAALVARANDFMTEAYRSASANIAQLMPYDLERFTAQIAAQKSYINNYMITAPLLDQPKTGPTEKPLDPAPKITEVENQTIMELIGLIQTFRDEVGSSQSSRLPNNATKFDVTRWNTYLDKMSTLLDFAAKSEPLDLPESTPDEPMVGPGNRGV